MATLTACDISLNYSRLFCVESILVDQVGYNVLSGFCFSYLTLVLYYLLLKVSEYFRGGDNLDNAVIAVAADDNWGQRD